MRDINVYLTFDGECREAMTFYANVLGGELYLMPFADAPGFADKGGDRIIHASVKKGDVVVMASDSMPGSPLQKGNNFSVSVGCESQEEEERFFAALSEGGTVTMPLQDTFWGARFGMLTDRFGIPWMFNFEKPKS
jgi:PhnB protein